MAAARAILGQDAVIGVTCSTPEEAKLAVLDGADYLGIGTIFATRTSVSYTENKYSGIKKTFRKENTKHIIGTVGIQTILNALSMTQSEVPVVAIGGINALNIQRVLFQSRGTTKSLDGVAVVSSIVGATDPKGASAQLLALMDEPKFVDRVPMRHRDIQGLLRGVPAVVKKVVQSRPVCHNMTNLVVQNFAANIAIAMLVPHILV